MLGNAVAHTWSIFQRQQLIVLRASLSQQDGTSSKPQTSFLIVVSCASSLLCTLQRAKCQRRGPLRAGLAPPGSHGNSWAPSALPLMPTLPSLRPEQSTAIMALIT